MKSLLILKDEDIFPNTTYSHNAEYSLRETVKCIVLDSEDKIALVGVKYRLLPGGGVESEESFKEAVKRECLEEVGCNVSITQELGMTEEYRAKIGRHQKTYCFVVRVEGKKGIPQTTQKDEIGIQVEWYSINEAIELLKKQRKEIPFLSYHSCFNVRTHSVFLEKFKREVMGN